MKPIKVLYKKFFPNCTTEKQYRLWKEAKVYAPYNFCTDCTSEYKEKMLEEGRCERPDIVFRIDKHGFIYGRPEDILDEEDEELMEKAEV